MEINNDTVAELVATKLANDYDFSEKVMDKIERKLADQVLAVQKQVGEKLIDEAVERIAKNWREVKLQRTNNWGDPSGEAVSLPQWIEERITQTRYNSHQKEIAQKVQDLINAEVKEHARTLIKQFNAQFEQIVSASIAAALPKIKIG